MKWVKENFQTILPIFVIIIFFVVIYIIRRLFHELVNYNIFSNYFIGGGLISAIIIWYINYCREENFNKKIRKRLNYELETNLAIINDDIYIIENNLPFSQLGLLDNDIFVSLINSHRIVIIPQNAVDHLLCFYTEVKNINRILDPLDKGSLEFALERLGSAKNWLEKIFNILERGQWYQENKLIGIKYQLKEE